MTETILAAPLALVLYWQKEPGSALTSIGLHWADGLEGDAAPTPSLHALALRQALTRYVAGDEPDWPELPFDLARLTDFQRVVLNTLRSRVGEGVTVSYGKLAALCGRPGAGRAVGRAMATNPWPVIFPCHRVVAANGALTGFTGSGLPMKRYLLGLEGVPTTPTSLG